MNRTKEDDDLCWFHGKVPRENAEQILRKGISISVLENSMSLTARIEVCSYSWQ